MSGAGAAPTTRPAASPARHTRCAGAGSEAVERKTYACSDSEFNICDPAMGSAAFLVEACWQLGDALVKSWRAQRGACDFTRRR